MPGRTAPRRALPHRVAPWAPRTRTSVPASSPTNPMSCRARPDPASPGVAESRHAIPGRVRQRLELWCLPAAPINPSTCPSPPCPAQPCRDRTCHAPVGDSNPDVCHSGSTTHALPNPADPGTVLRCRTRHHLAVPYRAVFGRRIERRCKPFRTSPLPLTDRQRVDGGQLQLAANEVDTAGLDVSRVGATDLPVRPLELVRDHLEVMRVLLVRGVAP